ncbi:MAG: hypothetical protein E7290_03005 [Lachnospiraceae bacterium]|nr:hypothetical protein [Lachnospiraceae bacterium]
MNREKLIFAQLQEKVIRSQKRGIHFIIASVVLWIGISVIRMLDVPILMQNMLTFCMSAPLMPLAYLISKLLGIPFQDKENPLSSMGIVLAVAQLPYLLIVMWVYRAAPNYMVMVYAMVTGAHFLPYGWYYKSKVYYTFGVLIPIITLMLGCRFDSAVVAALMAVLEFGLVLAIRLENRWYNVGSEELYNGSRDCTQ